MGGRSKLSFLQRRHTDSWKVHEKMLNITNYFWEMKMKTTMKHHLTPIMNDHHQKSLQTINAGEGVGKREPSYTVGGNANWYSQYGGSLKN